MESELNSILLGLGYVVLGAVILILAKFIKDVLTPYRIDDELTTKDNPALGLTMAGYFIAVIIVFLGSAVGEITTPLDSAGALLKLLLKDSLWALGGIVALNINRVVCDKLLLAKFSTTKEIIQDRNAGTGAVEAGCFIATGLILAGSINGQVLEGGPWFGILTAAVFFVLGQLALILFGWFYQLITRYDIHAEIERDNVAAGVAFGLSIVAIGIVLFRATKGDFVDWETNLWDFGYYAVLGFVMLMILRKLTDTMLMPGATIRDEIARDRNLNAAMLEGVVAMGSAAIIFFML